MKILLFSDLHLGMNKSTTDTANWIVKVAEKVKADFIVNLGDTFDNPSKIDAETLDFSFEFTKNIASRCSKYYVLLGNHDILRENDVYIPKFMRTMQDVFLVENCIQDQSEPNILLSFRSYTSQYDRFFTEIPVRPTGKHILFCHEDIIGSTYYPGKVEDKGVPISKFKGFHKVFCGHYHCPAQRGRIVWTGSAQYFNWSDDAITTRPRGVRVYDTKTDELMFYRNPTTPVFVTINDSMISGNGDVIADSFPDFPLAKAIYTVENTIRPLRLSQTSIRVVTSNLDVLPPEHKKLFPLRSLVIVPAKNKEAISSKIDVIFNQDDAPLSALAKDYLEQVPEGNSTDVQSGNLLAYLSKQFSQNKTRSKRKVTFKNIHIKRFLSAEDVQYSFKEGITVVNGRNLDTEEVSSNGAGKTSIFNDAIRWCLTGSTSRGRLTDDFEVTISFDFDEGTENSGQYSISRFREGGSPKLCILKDTENISCRTFADTQVLLTNLLGKKFFDGILFVDFLELGKSDQLKYIEDLLPIDFSSVHEDIKEEYRKLSDEYSRIEEKIQNLERYNSTLQINVNIHDTEEELSLLSSKLSTMATIPDRTQTIIKLEHEIYCLRTTASVASTQIEELTKEIDKFQEKIQTIMDGKICSYCGSSLNPAMLESLIKDEIDKKEEKENRIIELMQKSEEAQENIQALDKLLQEELGKQREESKQVSERGQLESRISHIKGILEASKGTSKLLEENTKEIAVLQGRLNSMSSLPVARFWKENFKKFWEFSTQTLLDKILKDAVAMIGGDVRVEEGIYYHGNPIETCSSGERSIVSLYIFLSILNISKWLGGSFSNVIILDEPFSHLDDFNTNSFVNSLETIQGYCVYIITNKEKLDYPNRILVCKKNGKSYLE